MTAARIVVEVVGSARISEATSVAAMLGLPLVHRDDQETRGQLEAEFVLSFTDERVELVPLWPQAPGPLYCDFRRGAGGFRIRHIRARHELLLRVIRGRHAEGAWPNVLDATAGLGRDTFLLAAAGCLVYPIERNPVVHALLRSGLHQARAEPWLESIALRIGEPILGDTVTEMVRLVSQRQISVVYLDPMFASDALNGKPKKEMQILSRLVGEQPDNGHELFAAARALTGVRVIVKRARHAPPLAGAVPNRAALGQSVRYDIYEKLGASKSQALT